MQQTLPVTLQVELFHIQKLSSPANTHHLGISMATGPWPSDFMEK